MISKKFSLLSAIQLLFLCLLIFSILRAPASACSYAALALQLWYEKMIPSLFPFMVLSGLIVRLDFAKAISYPFYPLIGRLYAISRTMCTTLLSGFLFGFPLGAKTIAEQYSLGQLSKPQAQYLLSFCNNIGPVYLLSFALPLLGLSGDFSTGSTNTILRGTIIAAFFGIPLLYGLTLRYTLFYHLDFSTECTPAQNSADYPYPKSTSPKRSAPISAATLKRPYTKTAFSSTETTAPISAASRRKPRAAFAQKPIFSSITAPVQKQAPFAGPSFLSALDAAVTSACAAIMRLGGYMVFFMVCSLLLEKTPFARHTAPLLEITSGLALAKDVLPPALLMTMLTFGGLSCFAQTYTCIRDTDLSFGNYCLHKLLQTAIAFCLYSLLFLLFSAAF